MSTSGRVYGLASGTMNVGWANPPVKTIPNKRPAPQVVCVDVSVEGNGYTTVKLTITGYMSDFGTLEEIKQKAQDILDAYKLLEGNESGKSKT